MAIARVRVKLPNPAGGGDAYNIWHVRTLDESEGTMSDLNEACNALEAFYTKIKSWIPDGNITVADQVIWDPLGSPRYANQDVKTIRTTGAQFGPALLAVTCTWYTDSATRSGRGRTFVGPWTVDSIQADGTLNTAPLAALRGAAGDLIADSKTANGWAIAVLSTKTRVARDVTAWAVRDRFAYLSSRRD